MTKLKGRINNSCYKRRIGQYVKKGIVLLLIVGFGLWHQFSSNEINNLLKQKEQEQQQQPKHKRPLVVDILSIGAKSRAHLQKQQIATFGTFSTVRHFFVANELTDTEPNCQLTKQDTMSIAQQCQSQETTNAFTKLIAENFMRNMTIDDPGQWLCAQARPLHALYQVQKLYETISLPEYLIILDDDSFFNLPKFNENFSLEKAMEVKAIAGCKKTLGALNFDLALGGFGLALPRAVLQFLMIEVLTCSAKYTGGFTGNNEIVSRLCKNVEKNTISEYPDYLTNSTPISVVELMKNYADKSPYSQYKSWTAPGYCLHADSALGYMLYLLFAGAKGGERVEPYKSDTSESEGICTYIGEKCKASSEACSNVDAEMMSRLDEELKRTYPNSFGGQPNVIELLGTGNNQKY